MAKRKSSSTGNIGQKKGKPHPGSENLRPFKPNDPRINRLGRPKKQQSVTSWLHEWLDMTPAKAATLATAYAKQLKKADSGNVPMAGIVALRVIMDIMNDPAAGSRLFATIMDRLEGKLPTTIRTWRDEFIDAIKNGEIKWEDAEATLGHDLATELFVGAGIPIAPVGVDAPAGKSE